MNNKMKNKQHNNVWTISKSNVKIVEGSKVDTSNTQIHYCYQMSTGWRTYLKIDRNFCSVHEEITSIRLRKGVYNLIVVISNEPNK